jgi:CSLREA domain-containing protein
MSQEIGSHRFTIHPRPLLLAILAAGWLLTALLPAAQAATFTVNSTADAVDAHPGDGVCATATHVCTLRAAIQEANALAGADIIKLPAGIFTLTLAGADEDDAATGDLDITDDLTLTGAGAASTIIDGGGSDRVLDIFAAAVNTPHVDIAKVTIENGAVQGTVLDGGGIWNSGTLTLTDSVLSQNKAGAGSSTDVLDGKGGPGGDGGGVWNSGTLTVLNTTLSQNNAGEGGTGGGCNPETDTDCLSGGGGGGPGGGGGGIYNTNTLTVTNTIFSHNTAGTGGSSNVGGNGGAGGNGGGIFNTSVLTVTNSSFSQNTTGTGGSSSFSYAGAGGSGAGIWNSGMLTVINSTLSSNTAGNGGDEGDSGFGGQGGAGGGIVNGGSLTLTNTTLSQNTAGSGGNGDSGGPGGDGGGIVNSNMLTVINSTLSQNAAGHGGSSCCTDSPCGGNGGGIANGGTLIVTNSTFSQNQPGGEYPENSCFLSVAGLYNRGTSTLRNTILANDLSQLPQFGEDCHGAVTDGGYNLASDTTCPFSASTSLNNTDPLLLPLQDNGGPTDTQALCTGPGTPDASCLRASPALDLIPPGVNGCGTTVATDQRGIPRPQGPGCDLGAVEDAATLLPFAALRAQVTLSRTTLSKLTPNTDHFTVQGAFILDPGSNGIAPPREEVRFTLADRDGPFFTQTLPRGAFLPFGHGSFFFRAPVGQQGLQSLVLLGSTSAGHFSFSVTGDKLDLREANHPPVTVALQIGADTGAQTLACRKYKQGWRCQ